MKSSQFKITCDDINDKSIFINWSDEERAKLFSILLKKMSLTYFAELINYGLPTLSEIKNGTVKPSSYVYFSILKILGQRSKLSSLLISSRNGKSTRIIDDYISPELLGLIHSDGFLVKNKKKVVLCGFTNKNKFIINNFQKLLHKIFECNVYLTEDKRDGTYTILVPSIIGRILLNKFGEKRSKNKTIPNLSNSETFDYIRGLFDGDGSAQLYINPNYFIPKITISMGDEKLAINLKNLLQKINIHSRIRYQKKKNWQWWNVNITRQKDVLRFIEKIVSNHLKR